MTLPEYFMVCDVESIGLHGEGFAVGWVVVELSGRRCAEGHFWCHPGEASGTLADHTWIEEHWRLPAERAALAECTDPRTVRKFFWQEWWRWANAGAVLCADVSWPVEARFLLQCQAESEADTSGPYPLLDVASIRLAAGLDPLATEARLPDERPAHDPLADARQSARLLIEALRRLGLCRPSGID